MRPGFETTVPHFPNVSANPWLPDYPNPPDLRFNYYKLMNDAWANNSPIAKAPAGKTVAVIGAGAAGLTAARELWRAGYNVRIFEASNRIGGRLYTEPKGWGMTSYEWGAMRMPFFNESGVTPQQSTNCLLAYFLNKDQTYTNNPAKTYANMSNFPNPGKTPGGTGIYMNQGYGPNDCYDKPTLIPWPNGGVPDNPDLQDIAKKVDAFITLFTGVVGPVYAKDSTDWQTLWRQIAGNYDKMSFSDLVFTAPITQQEYKNDGWFGGLGMNDYESSLFYTIGAGDGSWGAFYAISAMWFIRCVMFGYNSNLQSVSSLNNATSLPFYNDAVRDTNGTPMTPPLYRGIQSLCELLLYLCPPGSKRSLYQACADWNDSSATLFVNLPVTKIEKSGAQIIVYPRNAIPVKADYVVLAAPIWAAQLSVEFVGFDRETELPWEIPTAMAQQHLIASCKVFLPLSRAYWRTGSNIPQIIVSDTFVQDAYGVNWSSDANDAAILASYTWEDDALKLLSTDNNALASQVLAELDTITNDTIGQKVSPYVSGPGQVFQWSIQPTYRGCAKLYRQRNWNQCYDLMTYNQEYAAKSGLYFAGESYGTEGGWTEPALRTALDAVIRLVNNSGGQFLNNFTYGNYPQFDTAFSPDEDYPPIT